MLTASEERSLQNQLEKRQDLCREKTRKKKQKSPSSSSSSKLPVLHPSGSLVPIGNSIDGSCAASFSSALRGIYIRISCF